MIARLRQAREKDQGFTLVELLVVIIIIGILAGIAIPLFLNQRQKAADTATKSDLRNAATQVETFFIDHNTYAGANSPAFKHSDNVTLTLTSADATSYCIDGNNDGGAQKTFHFSSADGRIATGTCAP